MTTWSVVPARSHSPRRRTSTPSCSWLALVQRPAGRWAARRPTDRRRPAAMLALPPVAPVTGWRPTRLAADHYIRLDTNDYSVHPAVIGRRVEVGRPGAGRVFCDGRGSPTTPGLGRHQTITDPEHVAAARSCAGNGSGCCAPAEPEVETAAWPTTTRRSASTRGPPDGHHQDDRPRPRQRNHVPHPALKAPTLPQR